MKALATGAAAMSALLLPCSVVAKEPGPNIAITHAALADSARPQARAPGVTPPREPSVPYMPLAIATSRNLAALGISKDSSVDGEWAGGAFHLAAIRGRSESVKMAGQNFEYQHFSLMAIGADTSLDISDRDTLTLAGSYIAERRRPAFIVGSHRNYRTDERVAALHWTHDNRFDLAGSLFDTGPATTRTAAERIADIAGGASRSVAGWGLTASHYPAGESDRLSVGVEFRDQQDRDVQHRDARIQIFLRQRF